MFPSRNSRHGSSRTSPKKEQIPPTVHANIQQRIGFYPSLLAVGPTELELESRGRGEQSRGSKPPSETDSASSKRYIEVGCLLTNCFSHLSLQRDKSDFEVRSLREDSFFSIFIGSNLNKLFNISNISVHMFTREEL